MSANSKIEWTDRTWNPTQGCTKVSQGCKNCYAERMYERFNGKGSFKKVIEREDRLLIPSRWKKPSKIFVNSMSDLFHEDISFEFIAKVFHMMLQNPRHIFQILTKREDRMLEFFNTVRWSLDLSLITHIWIGVSVEDQNNAFKRIPLLLQTPLPVKFLSCEPLLGPVDLYIEWNAYQDGNNSPLRKKWIDGISWVIVGGESGPGSRPMHPDWVNNLRSQCEHQTSFFFKQWGEYLPSCQSENVPLGFLTNMHIFPSPHNPDKENFYYKIGKKKAGNILNGVEYLEFPNGLPKYYGNVFVNEKF